MIVSFPVITKPRRGSGSVGIEMVDSFNRLEEICKKNKEILIQEYIDGQEIGADIYVDLISNEVISVFTKKKLKMRAGETDKSVSFRDENLFRILVSFAKDLGEITNVINSIGSEDYSYFTGLIESLSNSVASIKRQALQELFAICKEKNVDVRTKNIETLKEDLLNRLAETLQEFKAKIETSKDYIAQLNQPNDGV